MLNTVNFFLHCKFAMLGIVVLLHLVAESDSYLLLYCFFSLYTWHYYACFQILFIYLFQLNNLLMYCFLLFSLHETCYWLYFVVFLLLSFTTLKLIYYLVLDWLVHLRSMLIMRPLDPTMG